MKKSIILLSTVLFVIQGFCLYGGDEFQVNTYTESDQRYPCIAMDSNGNFVIAWESFGQDTNSYGIYAQIYDVNSIPIGKEFRVNSVVEGKQLNPCVAMNNKGDFLIAWQSYDQSPDNDSYGVFAKKIDKNGKILIYDFMVNTQTNNSQDNPSVALSNDGHFVISWNSKAENFTGVYAQIFDSDGNPIGNEIRLSDYVYVETISSVAIDSAGNFVITWVGGGSNIYAKRFDKDGNPINKEFQVNSWEMGEQINPCIAMNKTGDFVIAWQSNEQDGSSYGVFAQRFDNKANLIGSEFNVNSTTEDTQEAPDIALDEDGNFIVTWHCGIYGADREIFAQKFDKEGNAVGDEFVVNQSINNWQIFPSIAMQDLDNFVITWEGEGDGGHDISVSDIYARKYGDKEPPEETELTLYLNDNSFNLGDSLVLDVELQFEDDSQFVDLYWALMLDKTETVWFYPKWDTVLDKITLYIPKNTYLPRTSILETTLPSYLPPIQDQGYYIFAMALFKKDTTIPLSDIAKEYFLYIED